MRYHCHSCGREISARSWMISPRCIECLSQLAEEYDIKIAKMEFKEKIKKIKEK